MAGSLRSEMLTFEPLKMVQVQRPASASTSEEQAAAGRLQTLELSNLDLLFDYYNTVALFYPVGVGAGAMHDCDGGTAGAPGTTSSVPTFTTTVHGLLHYSGNDPAEKLERALQELLLHYPAAAGRLHMNETTGRYEVKYKSATSSSSPAHHEDLMAYGVPFAVARANTAFSTLGDVSDPHPSLDILYPRAPARHHNTHPSPPIVLIQVTTFVCGSFTLAFMSNHMLMDAYGVAIFLKNLCSIAKGEGISISMDIANRREVLTPRVPPSSRVQPYHICTLKQGETHVKGNRCYGNATRFSFDSASLETLRLRASNPHAKPCSRFQALAALLWIIRAKCLAKGGAKNGVELPFQFAINMRGRGVPNLTQEYMGNALLLYNVIATVQELCEISLVHAVQKIASPMAHGIHMQECMQDQIDYIESQLQNGHVPYIDNDNVFVGVPSLVNLPFYDADCGWGCPIYCGRPNQQIINRMIILDNPQQKGWDVLIVLSSQDDYNIFEEEITKYTCHQGFNLQT